MRIVARLTRSRLVARALLGLELPAPRAGEHYFDVTTLALLRAARRRVPRGARVLDMGTGSFAVLGLCLWRELDCRVTCSDVDPGIAERARECVRAMGAPLRVETARCFEGLGEPFDYVLLNPPYVPTATGVERGLPEDLRTQWDGGGDGTETIGEFLHAFAGDGGDATALLGVNRRHVRRAIVEKRLREEPGVRLEAIDAHPLLPVDVYVLTRT